MLIRRALEIWLMGKTLSTTSTLTSALFTKFLMCMAAIVVLVTFATMMIASMVVGVIILSYTQMVAMGVDPQSAILIILAVMLALLSGIMLSIKRHFSKMQSIVRGVGKPQPASVVDNVSRVATAFVDGLFSSRR